MLLLVPLAAVSVVSVVPLVAVIVVPLVAVAVNAPLTCGEARLVTDMSPDTTSSMPGMALIEVTMSATRLLPIAVVKAATTDAAGDDWGAMLLPLCVADALEGTVIV
jgi:hypothetical protein